MSGVTVCSWSRTQNVIAQSSMEAEFMSVVTGLSEGLGVCSLLSDFGFRASLIVLSDSSAGRQACLRVGVGKVRHLDVRYLLVQDLLRRRQFSLEPVLGTENVADLLTRPVAQAVLDNLRPRLHLEDSKEVGALCATRQAKGIGSCRIQTILACSMFWAQAARAGAHNTHEMAPTADGDGQALLIMCLLFSLGLWLALWLVRVAFGRAFCWFLGVWVFLCSGWSRVLGVLRFPLFLLRLPLRAVRVVGCCRCRVRPAVAGEGHT